MAVAEKVRKHRNRKGLSQQALSEATKQEGRKGLSRVTISNIECGKPFRYSNLQIIASTLGVEIADLVE